MWGAVIGDIAGSRFEGSRGGPKTFELFHRRCMFTDDTVCTAAIAHIIVNDRNPAFTLIQSLAKGGAAIVMISSEWPELMNVAHRIIVMSGGRVRDEIPLPAFDERRILDAAFYERVSRLVLLCEDLLQPLPECGVTLHEAVSFLYRDQRSAEEAAMARQRRSAAGRRGAGHRPREPDLFDE